MPQEVRWNLLRPDTTTRKDKTIHFRRCIGRHRLILNTVVDEEIVGQFDRSFRTDRCGAVPLRPKPLQALLRRPGFLCADVRRIAVRKT